MINLTDAASISGVTEQVLRKALGIPPPDFTAAAVLGETVQELINVLGMSG